MTGQDPADLAAAVQAAADASAGAWLGPDGAAQGLQAAQLAGQAAAQPDPGDDA